MTIETLLGAILFVLVVLVFKQFDAEKQRKAICDTIIHELRNNLPKVLRNNRNEWS